VTQATWVLPSLKDPKPPYMFSLPLAARNFGTSLHIVSRSVVSLSANTYSVVTLVVTLEIKSNRTESVGLSLKY
jgi:hypothetical protein